MTYNVRLSSLSPENQAAFVADLWKARGFETNTQGRQIVAVDPETESRTVIELVGVRTTTSGDIDELLPVDVLVDPSGSEKSQIESNERNVRYLDHSDIQSMLLYAIDRETANQLTQRYFNQSISAWINGGDPQPTTGSLDKISVWTFVFRRRWPQKRITLSIAAISLIIVGSILFGGPQPTPLADSYAEENPTPTISPVEAKTQYPPGIGRTGITNLSKLIRSHQIVAGNRSYQLVIIHEGSKGQLVTRARWVFSKQVIKQGNGWWYYRVNGTLPPTTVGEAPRTISFIEYRNGDSCKRQSNNVFPIGFGTIEDCSVLTDRDPRNRFAKFSNTILSRYLRTTTGYVRPVNSEGQQRYRLSLTTPPTSLDVQIRDYTVNAEIGQSGMVWSLQVSYTWLRFDGPHEVRLVFHYHAI